MQRVEADSEWSLMCPRGSPGLSDCWGKDFEDLYTKYENEGRYIKKVKAQKLWFAILESQIETGNYSRLSLEHTLGDFKIAFLSGVCNNIREN